MFEKDGSKITEGPNALRAACHHNGIPRRRRRTTTTMTTTTRERERTKHNTNKQTERETERQTTIYGNNRTLA